MPRGRAGDVGHGSLMCDLRVETGDLSVKGLFVLSHLTDLSQLPVASVRRIDVWKGVQSS